MNMKDSASYGDLIISKHEIWTLVTYPVTYKKLLISNFFEYFLDSQLLKEQTSKKNLGLKSNMKFKTHFKTA